MKWKSKYIKNGTKCKVRRDFRDAHAPKTLRVGDVVRIEGRSVLKPLVICENEKGELIHIPSQILKRIKPEKPAFKVGDWVELVKKGHFSSGLPLGTKMKCTAPGVFETPDGLEQYCSCKKKQRKYLRPCAPSTVPEGCPVDEQCHRGMTAEGWYWARHGGAYTTDFADMHPDGQIYICMNIDADRRGIINKASDTLAAWRERANR